MGGARPLRVLLVANDGASVGHVTRAVAVAAALEREASGRGVRLERLLATTSAADELVAWSGLAALRLPAAGALPEEARRELGARVLAGAVEGFRPDLLVVDTFPSGAQLELAAVLDRVRWRALIRRTVRPERAREAVAAAGLDRYDRIVVPADPGPASGGLPGVEVPPIVLPVEALDRDAARAALGGGEGLRVLVSCGGRADPHSEAVGRAVAAWCEAQRHPAPVVQGGLLDGGPRPVPYPLARLLRGFDLAVISAGYNSAHECASVGLPAVLYARERAFDDQRARALRFEAAGLGVFAAGPADVAGALDRARTLAPAPLACDGAARCARVLLDLVGAG